ncbi:MAG: methyltransferase domain-containing protein [Candidatus Omnitrophota bacterium]
MSDDLMPFLACPLCKGSLKRVGVNQMECLSCKATYPVDDGIPILLPPQLEEFKILEAKFHSNNADYFAERAHRFSYRVSRYHDDYLVCFGNYQEGAVVLVVGGGGGLEACRLKNMGITVIESDVAVGMVKRARRRAFDNGQNAHTVFVVCDAEQLPCPDNSLDAVLIVAALHHLPSPGSFFAAANRALKPGGQLVIGFEPNRWPYYTVMPVMRFLSRMLHPNRNINPGETSIGDMETKGFAEADFEHFLRAEGLKKVSLQRIWYLGGFVHYVVLYINSKRPAERMIDLPITLQRALVAFDDFLSRVPLLRKFCWHWTLVAQRS